MRSISRVCDVSFNTVAKLLENAGEVTLAMHDELVRNVKASRIQCDEVWSFNHCKEKNVQVAKAAPEDAGDLWTWTALDGDSKLIVSYFVGDRSGRAAAALMDDLHARLANCVQLTTDGHKAYLNAVEDSFGSDIDYAMLVKLYGGETSGQGAERKYSPVECCGTITGTVCGDPDKTHVSTSYVERQNLTMQMSMRRFTRLTNAFSKKIENHTYMVALYAVFYNFIRIHKTLKVTPAMEAGITERLYGFEDILTRIEAKHAPKKRGH